MAEVDRRRDRADGQPLAVHHRGDEAERQVVLGGEVHAGHVVEVEERRDVLEPAVQRHVDGLELHRVVGGEALGRERRELGVELGLVGAGELVGDGLDEALGQHHACGLARLALDRDRGAAVAVLAHRARAEAVGLERHGARLGRLGHERVAARLAAGGVELARGLRAVGEGHRDRRADDLGARDPSHVPRPGSCPRRAAPCASPRPSWGPCPPRSRPSRPSRTRRSPSRRTARSPRSRPSRPRRGRRRSKGPSRRCRRSGRS